MGEIFSQIMCTGEDREKLDFCESLVFRVVGANKGEVEIDEVGDGWVIDSCWLIWLIKHF